MSHDGQVFCTLGHFHSASLGVLLQLYKFLLVVLSTLDYCSSLWDLHYAVHSKKMESVQSFAARVIMKFWRGSATYFLSRLVFQLPSLEMRRRKQKAALCFHIMDNMSIIPPTLQFFTAHPSPPIRHNHSLPLYYPTIHSVSHLSSFSTSVSPLE